MQIADLLGQYQKNIATGSENQTAGGAPVGGTGRLRQAFLGMQQLSVGNIFEGSINQIEDGVVTIGLADGKTIQARLESGISVTQGETMFFQVKTSSQGQIALRPFTEGITGNPTLLQALDAAGLSSDDRMITMVNTMMEQSMSIDRQSLQQMARLVMANPQMDAAGIVQMSKLQIPLTEDMMTQFENYRSDQYAITDQITLILEQLPERLSDGSMTQEDLLALNQEILQILADGADGAGMAEATGAETAGSLAAETVTEEAAGNVLQETGAAGSSAVSETAETVAAEITDIAGKAETAEMVPQEPGIKAETARSALQGIKAETIGTVLQGTEAETAGSVAQENGNVQSPVLKTMQQILRGDAGADLAKGQELRLLAQALATLTPQEKGEAVKLLSSGKYRTFVKDAMEKQWLLEPQELKEEHKIQELYSRLDRQMEQLESALKSGGQHTQGMADTASSVRSNIQFMNYLNQAYTYVQIPLKMAGKQMQSELYVYTDKRKKSDPDGELTAFLHLDMEHLGSTDVSVRLYKKQVTTNFYLEDDRSWQLVEEHLDLLQERLEKKGYRAKLNVIKQEQKKPDFLSAIMNQSAASGGGAVHRYSFDVRA